MNAKIRYLIITIILNISILIQPLAPMAYAQNVDTHAVYLPIISTKRGIPQFEITTPSNGAVVAGTVIVGIWSSNEQSITSVTFKAGNTVLGTDTTASDGFRFFLDARQFAAGTLELTVTAQGSDGESSKKITVQVVPDPPSSGLVNSDGSGVFDSPSGGVIGLCPGSARPGTQITVNELSRSQVTDQYGINWNSTGITFLGAQQVTSSTPVSQAYCIFSTAGYGNSVQPGQEVVNYQLVPDIDGDGVSEIVSVNSGNAAPNGYVVAATVPGVVIKSIVVEAKVQSVTSSSTQDVLNGKPGDMVKIRTTGLNALSPNGNLISFQSIGTMQTFTSTGSVTVGSIDGEQEFEAFIPMLPTGSAQIILTNLGTGRSSETINIAISTPNPLTRSKEDIINSFFDQVVQSFDSLPGTVRSKTDSKQSLLDKVLQSQSELRELLKQPDPAIQQAFTEQAILIENSGILLHTQVPKVMASSDLPVCFKDQHDRNVVNRELRDFISGLSFSLDIGAAVASAAGFLGINVGVTVAYLRYGLSLYASSKQFDIDEIPNCDASVPPPPQNRCQPTQISSGVTGMGAASFAGGSGCGNAVPSSPSQVTAASAQQSLAGRVSVKIYIDNQPTAFAGVTDESGYFYISNIPEGKPFTAIAHDKVSDESRNVTGIGPKMGESIRLFFDFTVGEDPNILHWDGGGDGTLWSDAKNWVGDVLPIDVSRVVIDAPVSTIQIANNVNIRSLQSNAAIQLGKAIALVVHSKSTINNSFVMARGSGLIADGVNARFVVSGATTLDGGELIAVDGGQIELPQATTYFGDVEDGEFYNAHELGDNSLPSRIEYCHYINYLYRPRRAVCATGSGSLIDLSSITTVIGKEHTIGFQLYTEIRALNGGIVNLSGLQVISKGHIHFLASQTDRGNSSGYVNLSQLVDTGPDGIKLFAGGFGQIDIGKLQRLRNVNLQLYQNSTITTTELTEISNSSISLDATSHDFSKVTNIDASSLQVSGGGKLIFSSVTSYVGSAAAGTLNWKVDGKGSLLSIPQLETLIGNSFTNSSVIITAKDGGALVLNKVRVIPSGHVQVTAEGTNSIIDLSSLDTFLRDGWGDSLLKVVNGGQILVPKLTNLDGVRVILDNSLQLNTAQMRQLVNGGIEATIVSPDFNMLEDINASSIYAKSGARISLPNVTSYIGSTGTNLNFSTPIKAEGAGSLVDLSNITAFEGNTFTNGATIISALNGGKVNLSKVPGISVGKAQFTASGSGSVIDLSSFSRFERNERGYSWLKVEEKGQIDLKTNPLTTQAVDIELYSDGGISVGSLTLNKDSRLIGIGTVPDSVINNGSVQPGDATGILQIAGNYSQTAQASLSIDIRGKLPGTLFDQVKVTGNAAITGKLEIVLLNSYQPLVGDTFEILTANSLTGTFTTITGTEIGNGKKFDVIYSGNGVTLKVVALP